MNVYLRSKTNSNGARFTLSNRTNQWDGGNFFTPQWGCNVSPLRNIAIGVLFWFVFLASNVTYLESGVHPPESIRRMEGKEKKKTYGVVPHH